MNASCIAMIRLLMLIVPVEAFLACSSFSVTNIFSSSACTPNNKRLAGVPRLATGLLVRTRRSYW